jgi:PAS domain S-box-containing protein
LIVDGVRDFAIFMLDCQGRVASWNQGAERLQAFNRVEAAGIPFAFFFSNEDIRAARPEGLLQRASLEGSAEQEGWQYRKDGTRFWARVVISALYDSTGQLCGFTNVTQDLSKQKSTEAELMAAKELAEAANLAKTRFLTNISHEIRTPLGAVLGFAELMNDPALSDRERNQLGATVRRNGIQLTHLINDLLDLSKVEADRLEIEALQFDFLSLLKDVIEVTQAQIASRDRAISLKVKLVGRIPSQISSDPVRIKQMFLNIVGNAVKFTETGSITIFIQHEYREDGCNWLHFSVRDTGIGMDDNQQARIFQPFSQADCSTTRKFGGTGLGLVLTRRLAQLMDGNLELTRSRLGKGSEFKLTIAIKIPEETRFVGQMPTGLSNLVDGKAIFYPNLAGVKILLVEDSADNQDLIKHILTLADAEVAIANNGQEGIAMAVQGNYDVVLMDVQMPVLDGIKATEKLRQLNFSRPIIAVTAHAFSEERERCLNAGCDDQITKPIDRLTLLNTIAHFARSAAN